MKGMHPTDFIYFDGKRIAKTDPYGACIISSLARLARRR